jgi:signal transduction histidine kinase
MYSPEIRAWIEQADFRAILAVPLLVEDRVIGVLGLRDHEGRSFDAEEIRLARAFADQAATALENARLYHETQQAYHQLMQTQEQLIQAQKMEAVGRLAGGVAHDFNNLLTVIIGRAQLLLMRLRPGEPLRQDLELIQHTAHRAASLTHQLLALSRKQILQPKLLDLNGLVTDVTQMLRRLIGEDIELLTVFDPALGQVRADPSQLEQVVLNLVVNARDAMPGGGQLTLETANVILDDAYAREHPEVQPGPYVRLAVRDTGIGMDAETRAHLFEPFFTTKGPGKGPGKGLAIVYGIVTQSGGQIVVDSTPEQGTTFTIYLPRAEDCPEALAPQAVGLGLVRGQETILLAEDDDGVREMVREMLQLAGYTVLAAANGSEALRLGGAQQGPIHLLLTDVVMPGMSGRELADRLVQVRPHIKVLFASGYTDEALGQHGVLDPAVTLLQKPFTPDALARKVREVLDAGPTR